MKMLCVGDSNTYGYDPRSFFADRYDAPWPKLLGAYLECECVNLGENGAEIPERSSSIEWMLRRVRAELPSRLLIIMLGTNDVLRHPAEGETIVRRRMVRLIGALREAFPDLPTAVIVPAAACGMDLSEALGAACGEWGVPLLNCCEGLPLAGDDVHLTEEGHRLLAKRLAEELKKRFIPKGSEP